MHYFLVLILFSSRKRYFPLNAALFECNQLPLHKLLFSATLTQNPEKLAQLQLFNPKLFVTQATNQHDGEDAEGKDLEAVPCVFFVRFLFDFLFVVLLSVPNPEYIWGYRLLVLR